MGLSLDFGKLKPHDVLDLAIFAEREAQDAYEHLAAVLGARGNAYAAEFFQRMASLEKLHHDQLRSRRDTLFPGVAATLADRWFWGIETPDDAAVGTDITVRGAYEFALESEGRAHDYYAQAKEYVTDGQLAALFEELRLAEAQHQQLLRGELARLA